MTKDFIHRLQNIALDAEFVLSKNFLNNNIDKPFVINELLIRKQQRFMSYAGESGLPFESFDTINGVDWYAYKSSFTRLGVLLFQLLFQHKKYIEIELPQPESEIKQLFIYLDRENRHPTHSELQVEHKETYTHYRYFPQEVDKFPLASFTKRARIENHLPYFGLACANYHDNFSEQSFQKSNQLIVSLTLTSLIQLAELFLDMGRIEDQQNEICLENPLFGCGGVEKRSIEARFWLPNSFGFHTEKIEDLKFTNQQQDKK